MTTLGSYNQFNIERFLKDRKRWESERKALTEKLEEISEIPAGGNGAGIKKTWVSDPTQRQAVLRSALKDKIAEIDRCLEAYEYVMSVLTDDERALIKGFFEPKMPIWKFVQRWEREHFCSETAVYKFRKRTLEKMGRIMAPMVK